MRQGATGEGGPANVNANAVTPGLYRRWQAGGDRPSAGRIALASLARPGWQL